MSQESPAPLESPTLDFAAVPEEELGAEIARRALAESGVSDILRRDLGK